MLEAQIENRLITQLKLMGYGEIHFTESFTMEDNIRECLNKVFKKNYTSDEVSRILRKIKAETDKTMKYLWGTMINWIF